jgi:hypothetical protein
MIENVQPTDTNAALADWEAQARDHARRVAEIRPLNKAALFDALARAGITLITATFDGYADSGQIERIDAYAGDASIALPSDPIERADPVYGSDTIERSALPLRDAIEKLAYDFLEETHGGWEDNDGAYGDFAFDVATLTITLAYNERHMESDYSEHVF